MDTYRKVYTETAILVNRLAFLLQKATIRYRIQDDTESGRLAGFGTPPNAVQLFVFHEDVEKATPIIEDFKKEVLE